MTDGPDPSEPFTNPPPQPTVSDCTERELIARIQQRLAPAPDWLLVGIGDDAAVVEAERNRLEVLSVDCLVDGVHFDRALMSAQSIGYRALAVNLSDLAAMGAMPRLALLSMALPPMLPLADFDGIGDGLAELAAGAATHIVGGNLTRTPGPLTIDITVVGTIKPRRVITRSGARPGDDLYLTGTVGGASAGLQMLRAGGSGDRIDAACAARYCRPVPRLRAGALLARNRVASACIDLSDGLAEAAHQIAEASGVGIALDADAVPIDAAARDWFVSRGADPVAAALTGGDDYELLFAVRPKLRRRAQALARFFDVPMTRIGVCNADGGATLIRSTAAESRPLPLPRGYGHFR